MNFIKISIVLIIFLKTNILFGNPKDTVFINVNNNNDRVMFFEKKYFIRIYRVDNVNDTILKVCYGQFTNINDTLVFTPPDSTKCNNKYFCFCKTKYDKRKRFQFKYKANKVPDNIDFVYLKMFNRIIPNYTEIRYFSSFKVYRKGKKMSILHENSNFVFLKQ